ncbi:MAG TPA: glycosyltransferase family 2 protein [Flavitalea sp.]|nr:glycosyltransferase family 2 protein [Flavitalea sp.]
MLSAFDALFRICIFIVLYTYIGYPLLLWVLVKIKYLWPGRPAGPVGENNPILPVSLIIAAYNEEDIIEEKIKNCFELNYPAGQIEYIFITDGSTDATPAIISRYPRIRLLHQPERKGKLAAMNRAVDHALYPCLIFSDANAFLNADSIINMTRHYACKKTGGVAGEKKILSDPAAGSVSRGEGLYWRYESALKKLDAQLYSAIGAAGELFSIRKDLYKKLPEHTIIEDFVQSLYLCIDGYRVAYEPEAYSRETASLSVKEEMERKTRISAGGFQAMGMLKKLFNVFAYPVLSFQFISHRVLRWTLCPLALLLLLPLSFALYGYGDIYALALFAQLALYALALAGWYCAHHQYRFKGFYVPFYFVMMNYCVFAGFARFLKKAQPVVWEKAGRKKSA